ncbi:hypothetical protein BN891_1060 [Bacteroides xylanisolvens SD CC 2a]|nr:hypothetical protein BN891_1060 [Bacteroides xylanisolvens SD CC 2a]
MWCISHAPSVRFSILFNVRVILYKGTKTNWNLQKNIYFLSTMF